MRAEMMAGYMLVDSERESSKMSSAPSSSANVFLGTVFVHQLQKLFSVNKLNLSWLNHSIFLAGLKAAFADQSMTTLVDGQSVNGASYRPALISLTSACIFQSSLF